MFQLAELLVTREVLTGILERISRLRLAELTCFESTRIKASYGSSRVNRPPRGRHMGREFCTFTLGSTVVAL